LETSFEAINSIILLKTNKIKYKMNRKKTIPKPNKLAVKYSRNAQRTQNSKLNLNTLYSHILRTTKHNTQSLEVYYVLPTML